MTFAATVNPVSYEKGIQVFVDSERETWNICIRSASSQYQTFEKRIPWRPMWQPAAWWSFSAQRVFQSGVTRYGFSSAWYFSKGLMVSKEGSHPSASAWSEVMPSLWN